MIRFVIRHWILLDLQRFREWLTDWRVDNARVIDNRDGTYGRAFDVRNLDAPVIIAASDTMRAAMQSGINAVDPLWTGRPRHLRKAPQLQALVDLYGTYDNIPADAWSAFDRAMRIWKDDIRRGSAEVAQSEDAA